MSSDVPDDIRRSSELQRVFDSNFVWEASEEALRDYLKGLNSDAIRNDMVRHRAIIRALTINHIQMSRVIKSVEATMERLNAANDRTQRLVLILTWVAVAVGVVQAAAAVISFFK